MKVVELKSLTRDQEFRFPLFTDSVSAGIPTPADSHADDTIDLNEYLVRSPKSTYFVRVAGYSMLDAGICDGDILIVDTAKEPVSGDIVIARLNAEMTVKRFIQSDGIITLIAENPEYTDIAVEGEVDFQILGVAKHVIHDL